MTHLHPDRFASGPAALSPGAADGGRSGKWMVLLAAFLGWMFDGMEQGLFGLTGRPALLELMGPSAKSQIGTWLAVLAAVFLVGAALGGLVFGWLGDRVGRVRAMVWSVATYSIFSGLCGLAAAPWQLALFRFAASLGMGGEWALGVALIMEVWPSRWRPLLAGLIGVAANAGFLLIALIGRALAGLVTETGNFLHALHLPEAWVQKLLANSGWRLLFILGALPTILTFFIRIFVPESEPWREAAATAPPNRVGDIFRGRLARVTIIGTLLAAIPLLATWGAVQWVPFWADKMAGAAAKSTTQIFLALGAMVACLVAPIFAQLTTRRTAYVLLSAGALAACLLLFGRRPGYGPGFLAWVFVVGGMSAGFYGWLPLYLPELFPTRVRATGQGFAYNAGRILTAGGTLGSGALLNAFHEDYARMGMWISLIYMAGLVVIWFAPETKGKPLPA